MGLAGLGLLATVLAALPYYIAGFADQPAAPASTTTAARPSCGTCWSRSATA